MTPRSPATDSVAGIPFRTLLELEQLGDDGNAPAASIRTVYASGSLIEGFGNAWSDLDIFVVGDREPVGPYPRRADTNWVSQHYVGQRRVDYEFWRPDDVRALARRLDGWRPGRARHITGTLFLFIELAFIHRLRCGVPILKGKAFAATQTLFDFDHLRAFQTEETIRRLDGLLEDMMGMKESGHLDVGLLRAREVLDAALDAYLHHLGNTDPTAKWRPVRLEQFDDGSERHQRYRDTYWRLQFPDPSLLENRERCHEHLERCARFTSEVIRWIQS